MKKINTLLISGKSDDSLLISKSHFFAQLWKKILNRSDNKVMISRMKNSIKREIYNEFDSKLGSKNGR